MKKFVLLLFVTMFCYAHQVTFEDVQALPKAELHIHLGGSFPLSYLKTIATKEQYDQLKKGIHRFVDRVDYNECFFIFGIISSLVNTNERIEDGTYALCKALQKDGVQRVELRTGLKDLGDAGCEAYLQAVLRGIERAKTKDFSATILLSVKRHSTPKFVAQTVELAVQYKNRGVIGIDISDNATNGDIRDKIEILKAAKNHGLLIVAHMGESPFEKDQMIILKELQPLRIGHGVHLKPEALTWILEHNIPVEVCPSSSVHTGMIEAYEDHPWIEHAKNGHPIIIGVDDTLLFRTTLTQEYMHFARAADYSFEQIKALTKDSFLY